MHVFSCRISRHVPLHIRDVALFHALVVCSEYCRDIYTVAARHTVFARCTSDLFVPSVFGYRFVKHYPLLIGQWFEVTECVEIVFKVLHLGHTAEYSEDIRE